MKFKIISLVFIFILLVGTVYAFGFSEDNVINNLVNNLGLNKPFLKHKEVIKEQPKELVTTKAVQEGVALSTSFGGCAALNGICVNFNERCPFEYWPDPSLNNGCPVDNICCTPNVIYLDSLQEVGRAYVYSGISLVARIDPE